MARGRRFGIGCVAAAVLATGAVVTAAPAGAAGLTITSTGTEVTATVVGTQSGSYQIGCTVGTTTVNGQAATPPVPCATTTRITFVGADGVDGDDFVGASGTATGFPALEGITYITGSGDDRIVGSLHPDTVLARHDLVTLPAEGDPDPAVEAATVHVAGTSGPDTITLGTPDASGENTTITAGNGWSAALVGTRTVRVDGYGGADVLDGRKAVVRGRVGNVTLVGGPGDDTIWAANVPYSRIEGGSGANALHGGVWNDEIVSSSRRDTVTDTAGSKSIVRDALPDGSGGRTLALGSYTWDVQGGFDDVAVRVRTAGGVPVVTTTLQRSGRQSLPGALTNLGLPGGASDGVRTFRTVVDLVPLATAEVGLEPVPSVVDIVVPTGTWTVEAGRVTFSDYAPVRTFGLPVHVRAPYADPDEAFVHRLLRDLEMALPSAERRAPLVARLAAGDEPAEIVASVLGGPVERDVAVERAYTKALGRAPDVGGRTYWSDRLGSGLLRRKMLASFFGAPEYMARHGATTPSGYVGALYADLLGRYATEEEVTYWADLVTAGTGRGTVADRLMNTPEARLVRIRDAHLRFADREPTPAEVASWDPILRSPATDGDLALIAQLAAAPAYVDRPEH